MERRRVEVREVGLRDGLQMERPIDPGARAAVIEAVVGAGVRAVEVGSFVSPKAVPALADTAAVFARLEKQPGVTYSALIPNRRGMELATAAGADEVHLVLSASETHNRENVRRSTDESIADVLGLAADAPMPVEVVISTAFGCPFEGDVPVGRVVDVARRLAAGGIGRLSLGDTTGMATPALVRERVDALRGVLPGTRLNMHFHNTRGIGAANVLAALEAGIDSFDASVGGLGGCPFAPGASGNVSTEDTVFLLEEMGCDTGIDLPHLIVAARLMQDVIGRDLPGQVMKAGPRLAQSRP